MKKHVWIVVMVVLVAVAGILFGRTFSTGALSDEPGKYAEPDKYALTGKTAVSPEVSPADAKTLELTYKWDEGWAAAGTLIIQSVTIKNNSGRSIDRAYISLRVFDGKNGTGKELLKRNSFIADVGPGKTGNSGLGGSILLDDLKSPRSFVITLESVTWKGGSAVPPATPPKTTPTTAVSNGSPGQVVKDFYQALIDGRYDELKTYVCSANLQKLASIANGYQQWVDILKREYQSNPIRKIEVLEVNIQEGGKKADVYIKLYYRTGSDEFGGWLVLEDTGWKVVIWRD